MRRLLAALLVVLAAQTHPFAASILYDNLTEPGFGDNAASSMAGEYTQAEDVLLRRRSHITGLSFLAGHLSSRPQHSEIAWLVFADDGYPGYPGTELARGLSPVTTEPFPYGSVSVLLASIALDVTLDPGLYWFALHGGPLELAPGECDGDWIWLAARRNRTYLGREAQFFGSCSQGQGHWSFEDGAWGTNDSRVEHGLQIRGVPEPATAVLLTLGALGWAGPRLRRRGRSGASASSPGRPAVRP